MIKIILLLILLLFYYFIIDRVKYYSDKDKIIKLNKLINMQ